MSSHESAVHRIFAGACERQGADRDHYLREQCGDDARLRAEVDELLALDAGSSFFGEGRLAALRQRLDGDAEPVPERIGSFRIVEAIGQGGMGVVYRAVQDPIGREVALKVLAPGIGGASARARFALEAEALGRLQHPGIAQILEAGSYRTASVDRPYLVMELVRGEPLHHWARRTAPALAAKVGILIEVCDAVHHAHQRGLIHRDLKPGNVFVDEQGRAKVLDFGIARLVDDSVDRTMQTRTGQLLGTLAYMSPEQAGGHVDAVDVRTDVYAVGALGYELLGGRLPIDVTEVPLVEALRRLTAVEPQPLGEVDRRLAGDLQTIFAMALRKEPERRYASMQALGDDLRRYLAHEPVLARRPTVSYVVARFARRHRGLVAGVAVAATALVAGTAAATVWAVRASAAAQRAEVAEAKANEETRLANRVTAFVEGLFAAAAPDVALGRTITARDMVEKGRRSIDSELAGEPLLQARLQGFLGAVLSEMGDGAAAKPLVDSALATLRSTLPPDDPRVERALLDQARARFVARDVLGARPLFAEALALHERSGRPADAALARCHEGLGACALDVGELDAALHHYTLVRQLRADAPDVRVRAEDRMRLGNVHNARGDAEAAEQCFADAHELLRGGDHLELSARVATNLGVLRINQGRLDEAEELFRESLAAGERVFGPDHPLLVRRLCNVAGVLSATGRLEEAEPLLVRALALGERSGAQHDDGVANVAVNLGNVRMGLGDAAAAVPLYERAAAILERLQGPKGRSLAEVLENLVIAFERLGDTERAAAVRTRLATIQGR